MQLKLKRSLTPLRFEKVLTLQLREEFSMNLKLKQTFAVLSF